jgi:protein-tyrosine phosphatase
MNQIEPYLLWLGHAGDTRAVRELFDKNIKALVHLAAEEPSPELPREFIYLRFPLVDGSGNNVDLLDLAIRTVARLLEKAVPTLVFCGAGMSRSPAISAAALAMVRHTSLEECITYVAKCHPTDLSPGLWADIRQTLSL